ncbi:major facilitator superfamily domain-containing protein [Phyllosticta citriasiana]|uniref:Major facilitator superfamily domain-containing protein n=1 Tax=Phyllosticta citriasiana TaxID=595635 RepID=A0ABR1KG91_9PEZI
MGEEKDEVFPLPSAEEVSTGSSVGVVVADWTGGEERVVKRRLDWHFVPLLTVLYLSCFLDRYAYIEGLRQDLRLMGHQFNLSLTTIFVLFGLVLMKRLGVPFLFIGFGLISLCTAFVGNFTDLMLARAFLGGFEGGVIPGFAFYLSLFYRRTELLFRISLFTSSTTTAGGLWWRNIFFFEGLITMLMGIVAIYFLVSTPSQCESLDEREKYTATERLLLDHRIDWMEPVQRRHVEAAIFNIKHDDPAILKDLGCTSIQAQLIPAPPFVISWFVSIAVAFASDRKRRRGVFIVPLALLGIVHFAVLISAPAVKDQHLAIFFAASGSISKGIIYLSWGIKNVDSPAVRSVAGGYITVLGTVAALTATWTYPLKNAPAYTQGHTINLGIYYLSVVTALLGIAYVHYENGARGKGRRDGRPDGFVERGGPVMGERLECLLGHRHPGLRYIP